MPSILHILPAHKGDPVRQRNVRDATCGSVSGRGQVWQHIARPLLLFAWLVVGGVAQGQVFVSPTGNVNNPGTVTQPLATIAQGIVRAVTFGQSVVRIKSGTYVTGAITVPTGKALEPGYDDVTGAGIAEAITVVAGASEVRFQTGSTLRVNLGTASDAIGFSFTSGQLVFESATLDVNPGAGFGTGVYTIATGVPNVTSVANVSVTGIDPALYVAALALNGSTLQLTISAAQSDIAVEHPAGTNLITGSASIGFGVMAVGGSGVLKTFTVKNTGNAVLTLAAPTVIGGDAGDFAVNSTGTLLGIASGQQTTFTVAFNPTAGGSRSTTLRISSNDPDENPFDITLTGIGLSISQDTDGDGMNDAAEFQLAALGFDWQSNQAALVTTYYANASTAGLYTTSQVQALHIGTPLLVRNPTSGQFTLTIGIEKSTNLTSFSPFPMTAPQAVINGAGKLEFQFTAPDNAAFFQLKAQ